MTRLVGRNASGRHSHKLSLRVVCQDRDQPNEAILSIPKIYLAKRNRLTRNSSRAACPLSAGTTNQTYAELAPWDTGKVFGFFTAEADEFLAHRSKQSRYVLVISKTNSHSAGLFGRSSSDWSLPFCRMVFVPSTTPGFLYPVCTLNTL